MKKKYRRQKEKILLMKNNMLFFETSAKTGEGVKDLFVTIANEVYKQQKK